MNKKEAGQKIREFRKHLKVTQSDLASISGVSLRNLIEIEAGKANPTFEVLEKICETLGLEIRIEVKQHE